MLFSDQLQSAPGYQLFSDAMILCKGAGITAEEKAAAFGSGGTQLDDGPFLLLPPSIFMEPLIYQRSNSLSAGALSLGANIDRILAQ